MQYKKLKINEHQFDSQLMAYDSYGKSVIICNFLTAQKLLKDTNQESSYRYKGHNIYINNDLNEFEYLILPIIPDEDSLTRFKNIYKYE